MFKFFLKVRFLLNVMRNWHTLTCLPALGKVNLKGYSLNLKNVLREIPLRLYWRTESSKLKIKTVAIIKLREDVGLDIYLEWGFIFPAVPGSCFTQMHFPMNDSNRTIFWNIAYHTVLPEENAELSHSFSLYPYMTQEHHNALSLIVTWDSMDQMSPRYFASADLSDFRSVWFYSYGICFSSLMSFFFLICWLFTSHLNTLSLL